MVVAGTVTPVASTEAFIKAFTPVGMVVVSVAAGAAIQAFAAGVEAGAVVVGSHRLSGSASLAWGRQLLQARMPIQVTAIRPVPAGIISPAMARATRRIDATLRPGAHGRQSEVSCFKGE